jgi:predicted TIM-barrel fold metal-dependent hydrolase
VRLIRPLVLSAAGVLIAGGALAACRTKSPAPAPTVTLSAEEQVARNFAHIPKIDAHAHIVTPAALTRALALGRPFGIVHYVNLSPGPRPSVIEEYLVASRRAGERMSVFVNLPWREAQRGPGYGARMAAALAAAKNAGAVGLKISKGLGLGFVGPAGALVRVDDPELDAVFDKAGELGMPVSIHTGDPKAFWARVDPANERFEELRVHPDWSNFGQPVPSWNELLTQLEKRVARHPRTRFVGVHFGNAPEDPSRVAAMLERHPNYFIDTAARVPEIGRHDPAEMRRFFVHHQDRILFGTDLGVGVEEEALMLGSTGEHPPTPAEKLRFYEATWRYFETDERDFEHPTPIQGRWKISGIKLPPEVLEKLYHRNAERLLGLPEVHW